MNNCDETLDSVPNTIVALVRARNKGASATSFLESTREWCGVTVPITREFWQGHVKATTMVFFCGSMVAGALWGCVFLLGAKTTC